jgi:hypothetical protein
MKKKYQSEQLMICHQDAEALYRTGAISEAEMREFDKDCLVPDPKVPKRPMSKSGRPAPPPIPFPGKRKPGSPSKNF